MEFNRELFEALFESVDVGIFVLDAEGRYLYVNPAYCRNGGHEPSFYLGNTIPGFRERGFLSTTVFEQVVREKKTVRSIVSITDRAMNRVYDALTTATPYFDEAGEIKYIFYTQETFPSLTERIRQGTENRFVLVDNQMESFAEEDPIIAESPQMQQLLSFVRTVAHTDASVLISGPSGSGKEVLARYIHEKSGRREKPLVVVNCAAIPETLIESELFGYEKGAFTGASGTGKRGLIEAADGGTLFLDEINSMPLPLQTRLLRVLETRQVTRLGSVRPREIDFRLICASNEDLQTMVREKRFRSDLFYRINVISVFIPPLRERREDIIPLALHFLQEFCSKYSCMKVLSPHIARELTALDWPGNVRELKNFMERLVVTLPAREWEIRRIPAEVLQPAAAPAEEIPTAPPTDFSAPDFSLKSYLDTQEKQLLEAALSSLGTPAAVADALKLDLSNVYRKMQKHGLKTR